MDWINDFKDECVAIFLTGMSGWILLMRVQNNFQKEINSEGKSILKITLMDEDRRVSLLVLSFDDFWSCLCNIFVGGF